MLDTSYAEDQHIQNCNLIVLYDMQPYSAYAEDLEFMWRWTIYCEHKLVQEGCSLTLDASKRSVQQVMAFFNMKRPTNKIEQEL
jgi:methane monooxygenase component D